MHPSRRTVLAGGLALATTAAAAPLADADTVLFATLDAVGPLTADAFDPQRALEAMQALMALDPEPRLAALRRYADKPDVPEGMFAVVRALVEVPPASHAPEPWPGVLQPGFLRPPALGAPVPKQPDDLTKLPRFPVVLIADVPLSLVRGYALGGHPEPLSMHLDGLAKATWRTAALQPSEVGAIRARVVQRFASDAQTLQLLEAQLQRLS